MFTRADCLAVGSYDASSVNANVPQTLVEGSFNPLPSTSVLIPSSGATLSGMTYLDATATDATSVAFVLFGGSYGFLGQVLCIATPTIYGYLCSWNTTTVPNGSYTLLSVASNLAGSAFSSGVNITVKN